MTSSPSASSPTAPAVAIADATQASAGDLIICTRNDHSVEAGESGRILANGDLLRVEAITRASLLVRRALDAHPGTIVPSESRCVRGYAPRGRGR